MTGMNNWLVPFVVVAVLALMCLRVYFDRYLQPHERLPWTVLTAVLPGLGFFIFLVVRAYRAPRSNRVESGIRHG